MASLFSDFLTVLGVRHTEEYSDKRFAAMPFQSMFGLANLLKEYGVGTTGVKVDPDARDAALPKFPTPFLADTPDGFAIVTKIENNNVCYMSQGKNYTAPIAEVAGAWNGIALLACVDSPSAEPDYTRHHIGELATGAKKWVLRILAVLLLGFAMWASGLYSHWTAWLLLVFDCIGIWLSWSLVQKAMGIHTKAANAVCSVLEEGGCDEIARSEAASFMGIFKWSEVGLAYFSVSLIAMLLLPQTMTALAAINIICLPYTVWSITYQKFKAKTWCTLCVSVQIVLWLLFACYLVGGWTGQIFPLTGEFVITFCGLGCCYVAALLGLNALDTAIAKYFKPVNDEDSPNS